VAESRRALLITSSVYGDPQLHELAAPRRDALTLGRILGNPAVGGFEVTRLTNPTSWRAAQTVEAFFSDQQSDDTLLLYFSGHGIKSDRGELFFAMRNTSRRNLRSTSLPASLVHDIMVESNSQRQILLLDCCYGGAFSNALAKSDNAVDVTGPLQGYGTVVLTASTALEFAWQEGKTDGQPQQSVFTSIVAEGLLSGEADLDGDGSISVLELHRYATNRIQVQGAAQTPTLSTVGQEGELVIARAPRKPHHADDPLSTHGLATAPETFTTLMAACPGADVYPKTDFRVELGPVFYRGRLDGTARVMVIGQAPSQQDCLGGRRVFLGEAGQRVQGFLGKLGIDRDYVMVNAYLYSLYGQGKATSYKDSQPIIAYRNRWVDALLSPQDGRVEAIVAFGILASDAFNRWAEANPERTKSLAFERLMHPAVPESRSDPKEQREMMRRMLGQWNGALQRLDSALDLPGTTRPLEAYGFELGPQDRAPIPTDDMEIGSPAWMGSSTQWVTRDLRGGAKRGAMRIDIPSE
jgi:uracil-DNA glycosylase